MSAAHSRRTSLGRDSQSVSQWIACLALLLALPPLAGCASERDPSRSTEATERPRVNDAFEEAHEEAEQSKAQNKPSPFGSAVEDLPLGRPPLRVRQYVVNEGANELIARPRAADFFCGKTLNARTASVGAFYRQAQRVFRRRGIDRLTLVVAPLTDEIDGLRPLARSRNGRVTLTARGRAERRC